MVSGFVESLDSTSNTMRYNLIVTSFELGNQFIPSFGVFVGDNKAVSVPIPIHISLADADTTKPFLDIKSIVSDPLTMKDRASLFLSWTKDNWLLLTILLTLGVFGLWFFFRKKNHRPKKPKVHQLPAHISANKSLKKLESKQLWQEGNHKQYSIELTQIVKKYLTERYAISTHDKTSSEILDSLNSVNLGTENKYKLNHLLRLSDLVKFAKEKPTAKANETVMIDAYQFVESTRVSEE